MATIPNSDAADEVGVELLQFALDLGGIIDPTPICDSSSALISVARGDWVGASLSAVSIIPFVGDMAKASKLPKYSAAIKNAISHAGRNAEFAAKLRPAVQKIKEVLDRIPAGSLPESVSAQLLEIRKTLEAFLGSAPAVLHAFKPFKDAPQFAGRPIKEVLEWLSRSGFTKVKDATLDAVGKTDSSGGSMIFFRRTKKIDGSGDLIEAIRLDVRGHSVKPHIPKEGTVTKTFSHGGSSKQTDFRFAYGERRHMHKEMIDAKDEVAYLNGGIRDANGKYVPPAQFDDAGQLTSSHDATHIWLVP